MKNNSLIKKHLNLDDIRNILYNLSDANIKNVEYVSLSDYCVVFGDFIIGLKYTSDEDEKYYMFISANSRFALPQQIAIGKVTGEMIYLTHEMFPNSVNLNFVAFPESSINTRTKGFVPRSHRDSIGYNEDINTKSEKTQKCLENGIDACEVFSKLLNNYNKDTELEKRKKLIK